MNGVFLRCNKWCLLHRFLILQFQFIFDPTLFQNYKLNKMGQKDEA